MKKVNVKKIRDKKRYVSKVDMKKIGIERFNDENK